MFWSSKHFEFTDIPNLEGKVAIITGSNTGIGKVCALEMARKNCEVVVACRNVEKGEKAVAEIKQATGNDKVVCMKLDLMSLETVKQFADDFKAKYNRLDILMHNAGVIACSFVLSEDGIESQFATNHVAPHYLTILLLPLLEQSAPSRIVNVSSSAHMQTLFGGIRYDKITDEKSYKTAWQYGITKAANMLFARELNNRLKAKGINNIYMNCNHPGVMRTEIGRQIAPHGSLTEMLFKIVTIPTEKGALTQLYLATSPEVEEKNIKAKYYVPNAQPGWSSPFTSSDKNAAELWDFTEQLLKEKIPDYPGAGI